MKALLAVLCFGSGLAIGSAFAQALPPNEAGVTMGHLHLNSRDVETNNKLFVTLGGTAPIVTQPTGAKLTFIHDPRGTSIELNERPNPL